MSKLDSKNLEIFLGKRSFFWLNQCLVFKTFSLLLDTRQMFFEFWKQTLKIVSLSGHISFSRKKTFLEKKSLWYFFSERGRGGKFFFRNLWKKRSFGGKLSGGLSERDSTLPEGLFEERHVFPKNFPIKKIFSNIQHNFSFLSFFWRFIKKVSLCPDEIIEEIFLRT